LPGRVHDTKSTGANLAFNARQDSSRSLKCWLRLLTPVDKQPHHPGPARWQTCAALSLEQSLRSEIPEFPGCIASGDTAVQSLANLKDVAGSWPESVLARGNVIPEPMEENEFSGKLVLRFAKSIRHKAAKTARYDGVSLNTFIANCVAEQPGCRKVCPMTRTLDSRADQAVAAMLQPGMQRALPGTPNAPVIDASVVNR